MKITVLNGNPDTSDAALDTYLSQLSASLKEKGSEVTVHTLRDMDIRYCIGCFGCWVKTPGQCSTADDDTSEIRRNIINSDLIIFASPVIMGFTSALLKRVHDKFTPMVLPYSNVFYGESHHLPRYDRYPLFGLILQPGADTDEEDIDIIKTIYDRDSLNFHTSLAFTKLITDPVKEVADEINGL